MVTLRTSSLAAFTVVIAFGVGCGAKSTPSKATFESKLTDVDRKAALAQKFCPVSDKRLFSMGPPIKVTVEGRGFFICCASCEGEAEENFDAYFAEVKAPDSEK
jgi:hypothetical protein